MFVLGPKSEGGLHVSDKCGRLDINFFCLSTCVDCGIFKIPRSIGMEYAFAAEFL